MFIIYTRVSQTGANLVSWGAIISKGTKGGNFLLNLYKILLIGNEKQIKAKDLLNGRFLSNLVGGGNCLLKFLKRDNLKITFWETMI